MHSTKTEILALLKRTDGASVDEISSAVGLAPMTVRQHLTGLERDDLVHAQEVRRATGRPHFRYQLTAQGHRSLADGYDRLVALLVDSMPSLNGTGADGARRELFRRAAEVLGERHQREFEAVAGKARIERVVDVLRAHGGFAEYHAIADGFEVRDFGCVFRALVGGDGPCEWHETFLRTSLGEGIASAPSRDGVCADCCAYVVPSSVVSEGPRKAIE
jgi:predicted ArsR family transcriptional regulator